MKTIKAVSLFYTEGKSDKVYHTQLCETDGGFVVNFQYGRRNSTLQTGTKTAEPVDQAKAAKVFDKLIAEKVGKGYTPEETGEVFSTKEFIEAKTNHVPQLLNAIDESELKDYLHDSNFIAQEKHDGERRLVEVVNGKATGINRKGLAVQLPDSLKFDRDMVIDCEIIGDKLFVFDVLSLDGRDTKDMPLTERISLLNSMKFSKNIKLTKTVTTTAGKQSLLNQIKENQGEGIVFKKKDSLYTGGRPSSGGNALKYKLVKTATFIVSNITKNKRSVGLVVLDGSTEVEVGKVTILPNFPVPKVGSLIEVQYLYAHKGGAVFQPVYKGERTDLERSSAVMTQLIYKAE